MVVLKYGCFPPIAGAGRGSAPGNNRVTFFSALYLVDGDPDICRSFTRFPVPEAFLSLIRKKNRPLDLGYFPIKGEFVNRAHFRNKNEP